MTTVAIACTTGVYALLFSRVHFDYEGWRFEVVDLDGRRIDKLLVVPPRA
jgi:CBS domain containing-hemolysin-like protein